MIYFPFFSQQVLPWLLTHVLRLREAWRLNLNEVMVASSIALGPIFIREVVIKFLPHAIFIFYHWVVSGRIGKTSHIRSIILQLVHKIFIECLVFRITHVLLIRVVLGLLVTRKSASSTGLSSLLLVNDKFRSIGVLVDALEVHGIIELVLGLDDFLKEEIVMSFLEGVKINFSVVPRGVRAVTYLSSLLFFIS